MLRAFPLCGIAAGTLQVFVLNLDAEAVTKRYDDVLTAVADTFASVAQVFDHTRAYTECLHRVSLFHIRIRTCVCT
jgi:hypothetical protein